MQCDHSVKATEEHFHVVLFVGALFKAGLLV